MSTKIILIGGLLDDIAPADFVAKLKNHIPQPVEWEWVWATQEDMFQPAHKAMMRLIDQLRAWSTARKRFERGGPEPEPATLIVAKLFDIHGRTASDLFRVWPDPVQIPAEVRTSDEVVAWLASPDAGLFPRPEWLAGVTEASIVAILCKLLRNKSWNPNVQGHHWTKEVDLLTQAPVQRTSFPQIGIEARRILDSLSSSILLTKGAGQGKTPKEWSINTQFLPAIKRAVLRGDLTELSDIESFQGVLQRIARQDRTFNLIGEIVSERVYAVCRN